jgi:hypothetical protein
VTADFTVGTVSNGASANQVIIFAETKPVFHLPPVEAGFYDFARRSVRVVSDNNVVNFWFGTQILPDTSCEITGHQE